MLIKKGENMMLRVIKTITQYAKAYFKVSTLIVITGLIYSLGGVIRLDAIAQAEIDHFISRATFEYEEVRQLTYGEEIRRYYTVSRETFELEDPRDVFTSASRDTIGKTGDVFVTRQSPFPSVPIVHQWISFFFGGHAAILDENNRLYEATGLGSSDTTIPEVILHPGDEPHDYGVTTAYSSNYWLNPYRRSETDPSYPYYGRYNRNEFLTLRVKNTTDEMRAGAVDFARRTYTGERLYNYTFFLDMTYKFYCTDLISRAYQDVLIPENKQQLYSETLNDRFITSVNDLINDEETYISSYVYIEGNIVNIYYLEDVES